MRFYGQWNPPVDEVIYRNYFLDKRNGVAIECGAAEFGDSCKFFEDELGWLCYNIEASKYTFGRLTENRPNSININAALSNKVNLNTPFKDIISAPGGGHGNGSLKHLPKHVEQLSGYGVVFEEYDVQTLTYKELVNLPVNYDIDLLVLDVEGHELEVIEGMKDARTLPKVIVVEYPIVTLGALKESLKEFGYIFNFVSFNNAFFSFQENEKEWFGETELMYL